MKRVTLSGIGRLSAATYGPSGGRSQLPVSCLTSALVAGAGAAVPADDKEPAVPHIARLLAIEDILLDVEVAGKKELIDEIGRHMQQAHALPLESVVLSLSHREQIGSTGLGQGVAIPHARVKSLDHVQAAYLRLKSPIPFDAPDGKPVIDVLVLLVPKLAAEEHLTILAESAQMFSDRRLRDRLHLCGSPMEVKRLIDGWAP